MKLERSHGARKTLKPREGTQNFSKVQSKVMWENLSSVFTKLVIDKEESNRADRRKGLFVACGGQSSEGNLGNPQDDPD